MSHHPKGPLVCHDCGARVMSQTPFKENMHVSILERTARLDINTLFVGDVNPRRSHNPAALLELEVSIRERGILVPLLVRPADGDRYEIIAGSRRLTAAQAVGLREVPCIVRSCDDAEARALALVDNLQREDVHPLEEAEGYAALQDADPRCTVDVLAAQVGRSPSYIRRRLKLRNLVPPVAEACRTGEITIAHAEELAGLHPGVQPKAFEEGCFDVVIDWEERIVHGIPGHARVLRPLRELREWIRQHTKIDVTQPETIELFPQLAELQAESEPLLEISTARCRATDVPVGVLPHTKWRPAEAKREQCEHRQRAVVVHGSGFSNDGLGEIRWVCATRKCAKHFPPKPKRKAVKAAPRPSWQEQEAERKREEAAYQRLLHAALDALAQQTRGLALDDRALMQILQEQVGVPEYLARITRLCGGAITLKTFAQALVLADAYTYNWPGSKPLLGKLCKAHGVTLAKLEKGLAKAPDPPAATVPRSEMRRLRKAAKTKITKTRAAKKGRRGSPRRRVTG